MKRATVLLALAGSCLLFAALTCAAEEVQTIDGAEGLPDISAGLNRKLLTSTHKDEYGCEWQTNSSGEWCWKRYDGKWINCHEKGTWKSSWHDKYCYDYQDHYGTCWKKDHNDGHWCWQHSSGSWMKCPETSTHCSDSYHKYCYEQTDKYGRCWRKESDGCWSYKQSYSCWSCGWTKTQCKGSWSTVSLQIDVFNLVDICLNIDLGLGGILGGGSSKEGGLLGGLGIGR